MKRTAKRNTKEETRETADSKAVSDEVVEPSVDPKEEASTVEPAEETLDSLRGRIQELENKLLREKADFANTQRRLANERSDAIRFANADLMKSLLPVLDDFERAIEAAAKAQDVEPVLEGTKLVYENFIKALGNQPRANQSEERAVRPDRARGCLAAALHRSAGGDGHGRGRQRLSPE